MELKAETGKEYVVKLSITAASDADFSLYTNRRRILIRQKRLKKGDVFDFSFACAPREADFLKEAPLPGGNINLTLLGEGEITAQIKETPLRTVYCLGDSTVCDQTAWGKGEMYRCCGWGQTLGMYFKTAYAVSNHAEQGTHTADCLSCHIKAVERQIKPDDIVLVQFGHNDQKQSFLQPFGGYKRNLAHINDLICNCGGKCVFLTPINRLIYVGNKLNTYLDAYAEAVREAAAEKNAPLIDLHRFTSDLYTKLGQNAEDLFFHGEALDRTHTNDIGACTIGKYVSSFFV